MRIVISGVGEVGTHLAKMLSGASHDITVIDDDPKRIEEVAGMADVVTTLRKFRSVCVFRNIQQPDGDRVPERKTGNLYKFIILYGLCIIPFPKGV